MGRRREGSIHAGGRESPSAHEVDRVPLLQGGRQGTLIPRESRGSGPRASWKPTCGPAPSARWRRRPGRRTSIAPGCNANWGRAVGASAGLSALLMTCPRGATRRVKSLEPCRFKSRVCNQFDIGTSQGVSRELMSTRLPRTVLVLVLVALMLTLTPLAYATSPDPTWIAGFWDDDDFDDVVGYITSAAGLLHTPVACELRPLVLPGFLRPSAFQAATASVPRSASSPRAPPTF